MLWPNTNRYLTRLNAPPSDADRLRTERVLGLARALLAVLTLVALSVYRPGPARYAFLVLGMVLAWLLYSCLVAIWLYSRKTAPDMEVLHSIDMLWPGLITLFTQGPSSPLFGLFMFSLVAAGLRWGFPETMGTAVISVAILDVEALILRPSNNPLHDLLQGEYEINRLIVRCGFLIVLGFLIGMGAENEKERRAEASVTTRLLHAARPEAGIGSSLHIVLSEFMRLFSAKRAYVVVQEFTTSRLVIWCLDGTQWEAKPRVHEAPPERAAGYLLRDMPGTFYCRQTKTGAEMTYLEGGSVRTTELAEMPRTEFEPERFSSMMCVTSEMGGEWLARLALMGARVGENCDQEMAFAEGLSRQAGSALYSIFLIRRLRSRAGAMERARVSRELHDGAIQSLISAEMRVDVLRRRAERSSSEFVPELSEVQQLLRKEVLDLRELMQQMRPVDLTPQQLLDYIADMVDRFRRDTGIEASFISDLQEVHLTPHTCRELVRIVQEGLVNIRKHARSTHAVVHITRDNGALLLVIADDGCGFGFNGRLAPDDLSATSKGPTIIKERVRGIGGQLSIESKPGLGSRLEITLPPKGKTVHG